MEKVMVGDVVSEGIPGVASRSSREVIRAVCEEFEEFGEEIVSEDPLGWPGYEEQLEKAEEKSGERESVITGEAEIGGTPAVVIAFDFGFLGGSMGEAAGKKIVAAFERAVEKRRAVVSLVATGGARMQEGTRSLVQMQNVAEAISKARDAGVPHISVLRHPTTGGVWASLAAAADYIIGIKGASVSFAGSRVRSAERGADEDDAFTASGKFRDGFIDMEAGPEELPEKLARVLALLSPDAGEGGSEPPVPRALGGRRAPRKAWAAVARARRPHKPGAQAYLEKYFDHRVDISGDRVGGVDGGMICGFGSKEGRTIAYAAQTGTANAAAGFRTAKRLIETADRLRIPVLTLIDTPGAGNEAKDEREGIGTAIAELFLTVAEAEAPMTSLVIGEGGSGGALALAAPDNLWITPDSYFAVIAPEGAAAIIEKDASKAEEVSERMMLRPRDLVELGVVKGIASTRGHPARVLKMPYDIVRRWVTGRKECA
ncbi:MAG: carboxyl transferase domain-containing protein [Rubrobacteraceae bacterium]